MMRRVHGRLIFCNIHVDLEYFVLGWLQRKKIRSKKLLKVDQDSHCHSPQCHLGPVRSRSMWHKEGAKPRRTYFSCHQMASNPYCPASRENEHCFSKVLCAQVPLFGRKIPCSSTSGSTPTQLRLFLTRHTTTERLSFHHVRYAGSQGLIY